jgi:hypothetical protein
MMLELLAFLSKLVWWRSGVESKVQNGIEETVHALESGVDKALKSFHISSSAAGLDPLGVTGASVGFKLPGIKSSGTRKCFGGQKKKLNRKMKREGEKSQPFREENISEDLD